MVLTSTCSRLKEVRYTHLGLLSWVRYSTSSCPITKKNFLRKQATKTTPNKVGTHKLLHLSPPPFLVDQQSSGRIYATPVTRYKARSRAFSLWLAHGPNSDRLWTVNILHQEKRGGVADYRYARQHDAAAVGRYVDQLPLFDHQIARNLRVTCSACSTPEIVCGLDRICNSAQYTTVMCTPPI